MMMMVLLLNIFHMEKNLFYYFVLAPLRVEITFSQKMITNINYKGQLFSVDGMKFSSVPPYQSVIKLKFGKLLVFPSGKCRIMGIKTPLTNEQIENLSHKVKFLKIQSMSLCFDLECRLNLRNLTFNLPRKSYMYEPELFPAMRLLYFNPLCVNIFSSGKLVILGLTNQNCLRKIQRFIKLYIPEGNYKKITLSQ